MDMLLAINSDAAKFRKDDGSNLLHYISFVHSTMPPQLCIVIMQRILALHRDAVREVDEDGKLPIHDAAIYWPLEVMVFLLDLYPESATAVVGVYSNLLIYLLDNTDVVTLEEKVRFLCSRYPQLLLQKDVYGSTALYQKIMRIPLNFPVVKLLCEAGGRELVSVAKIRPPPVIVVGDDQDGDAVVVAAVQPLDHGWLPLHMFVYEHHAQLHTCLPFSDAANFLRMLLHLYPEAVGIEAGTDDEFINLRKTPYQLAADDNVDPYYLRMMLHAVPDLNPAELHRLNYAERRMAMFLAFKAVTADDSLLLPRLRFVNKDLLKRVVSFL